MMTRGNFWWIAVPPIAAAVIISRIWYTPWTAAKVAGLIMAITGFVMVSVARYQLGSSFSIRPQARALVTSGIYSVIRHPVYVFGFIGIAGVILYIQKPALLWLLVPLAAMQVSRARAEERVLTERFGEDYRRYRQRTWL